MDSRVPAVLSWPRLITLLGAVVVTIGSGTNYGFSGWAPQLGAKLRLSHTELNVIALAGNLGVYSSGPIWGRIVDSRGPFILFSSGLILLLLGYSGIRFFFNAGLPSNGDSLPTLSFLILIVCGYMTGAGGNGGLTGAMNSIAKTFPDRMRATTAGIVLSGFGLSAFFFSEISRLAFGGKPSPYLNLLAWGTAIAMLVGLLVVRPIALPASEIRRMDEEREGDEPESHAPLLNSSTEDIAEIQVPKAQIREKASPNVFGKALWTNLDFWALCIILVVLSGTGLMYINNVGSITQVLASSSEDEYDPDASARWQATQVSTISVMNCSGRILFGLLSDLTKKKNLPRSFCLLLVTLILLVSQLITANVDNIEHLWKASASLGFGYGGTYVLMAALIMDYFGLAHFSENWGYVLLSPMVGGNVFSLAFGRDLDAHEPSTDSPLSGLPAHTQCTAGRHCYLNAIYMTIGACLVGTVLSVWISWRDWKRQKESELEDWE